MKINLIFLLSILLCFSCAQAPKSDKADVKKSPKNSKAKNTVVKGDSYTIVKEKSKLTWIGTKPSGRHNGKVNLIGGKLYMDKGKPAGGSAIINMKSLVALDQDAKGNQKLAGHLKSKDFFNVEKFPTAEISNITFKPVGKDYKGSSDSKIKNPTHIAKGDLTILKKTNSVSFPVVIANNAKTNQVNVKANFNIDRSKWGITYGNDKSLGDRFIKPEINFGVDFYYGKKAKQAGNKKPAKPASKATKTKSKTKKK